MILSGQTLQNVVQQNGGVDRFSSSSVYDFSAESKTEYPVISEKLRDKLKAVLLVSQSN